MSRTKLQDVDLGLYRQTPKRCGAIQRGGRNQTVDLTPLPSDRRSNSQGVQVWGDVIRVHDVQAAYEQPVDPIVAYLDNVDLKGAALRWRFFHLARKAPHDQLAAERVKFERLSKAWLKKTRFLSNPTEIILNSNYLKIIGMGKTALPFIYGRLKSRCEHWFVALESITDHSPELTFEGPSKMLEMQKYWVKWLEDNGFTR